MKKFIIALFIFLVAFLALLPTIISIPAVHQWGLSQINSRIPGKISLERIEASWNRGITISQLELQDPKERVVARSERIVSEKPLLSWLLHPTDFETVLFVKPTIVLIDDTGSGSYSIQELFSPSTDQERSIPDHMTVDIHDGALSILKQGNVSFSLSHVNSSLSIVDGQSLFFNKPLTAQASFPELSANADLKIEGFQTPISPFSLEDMKIHSVTIDPGIVTMQNRGLLTSMISLLQLNLRSNGQVPMWFTPIYLKVHDGILTWERTDILVSNSFPIALWGEIDLIKDAVNMHLGLSAQTLRRAFGLIIINSDYFLPIPIHGSITSPQINSALATSRIASLRLQQTPFPQTILFGTLFRTIKSFTAPEEPPPPPTTTPFPWS